MAFLRNLLATIVGLFIFCFLGLMLLVGIAASSESVPSVAENSVLKINLSGVVVERSIDDEFQNLFNQGPAPVGVLDLIRAIDAAKTDSRIAGIYLQPGMMAAGHASLQEIRDALIDFKTSGKFVYAYGEYVSEGAFYVISAADSIYLNPEGSLELNGLTVGVTFFKGLFDKLEVEPEIFRVGEFKSYVEPFIRKDLSPENKLQLSELIHSLNDNYLTNLSQTSGLALADLKEISNKMKVRDPQSAESLGLVTAVAYEDQAISSIKARMGKTDDDKITLTDWNKYRKAIAGDVGEGKVSRNKIAVIVAEGDIMMGEGDGIVGSEQFAREIREARESSSVKAIVLRVNSPGGSLTASDIIWREIMLTKGKKPVIASMSDVAASGGYFIAMPCDTIVAQPNTITGSIGIFGMMFNFGKMLENKLGITNQSVSTGEYSDMWTVTRSLEPFEREVIQKQVEAGYETFTTKAAEARGMSLEELKKVAGGRVWTGVQAKEKGLVDVLGSFEDAVTIAAEKAGLGDDYRVSYYPRQKPFIEKLMEDFGSAKVQLFDVSTPLDPVVKDIEKLQRMQGIQVRMPGDLKIQ